MTQYIVRRIVLMVPVVFLVTVMSFVLLHLAPGDPVVAYAGQHADRETIASLRKEFGLDRPLPVQYFVWLDHMVHGDLGVSIAKQRPVTELIVDRFPKTLELGLISLVFSSSLATIVGIVSALKRDSLLDLSATSLALFFISIPSFVVAFLLIILFSLVIPLFPPGGYVSFIDDPLGHIRSLVLPAIAVGTLGFASIMRHSRSSLLEVLSEDYIRTARAKGLTERMVVFRHALRNAFIPVATILGLQIGVVIESSFIIETIFAWPGLGRLLVQSINLHDYPVVQGTVMLVALSYMASTLLTDIAYTWLDPRISYTAASNG